MQLKNAGCTLPARVVLQMVPDSKPQVLYSLREISTATTHKMQTFEDQRQAALRGWNLLAACGCRGSKTHECGTLARTGISRLSTKQLDHSQADEGR